MSISTTPATTSNTEQVTLFATIFRNVLVFLAAIISLLFLAVTLLLSSSWIQYAIAGGFIAFFSTILLGVVTYFGGLPPNWAWAPPSKREKDCGRVRFSPKKLDTESPYDVIIIGSGISGLTTAAILVQLGYSVCVLEAHEVAGGSTHEYNVHGNIKYSFPSGLHYVIPQCEQLLQASCGARYPTVKFPKLGNAEGTYERIRLPRIRDGGKVPDLPIQNEKQLRKELHARYPGLKVQLERFENLATSVLTCFPLWSALHILPWAVRKPISQLILPSVWWRYANRSAEDVLTELFADAPESEQENVYRLQAYLCALWVDTGCPPHRVSFFMIAAVSLGFPHEGGAYPVGGPHAIGATLVERIESESGRSRSPTSQVLVRAPVQRILVEEGRAVGVQMTDTYGEGAVLKANKCVVSACGWRNTARLVADTKSDFPDISKLLIPQGEGFCMANVGIRGTAEELGLECCNLWPQPAGDNQSIFDGVRNYLHDPLGVPTTEIPLMITFPTLKDRGPKQDSGYQTAQILALAKAEWFMSTGDDGEDDAVKDGDVDSRTPAWKHPERNEEYQKVKQRWSERLQEAFLIYYPQLKGKIELFDLATPLSIEHYLPTGSGSAIGLDVNAGPSCRFTNFDTMNLLDMKTPVPGLWITGQDTLLCGVPLAQAAGLITALRIAGPIGMAQIVLQTIWLLLASYGEEVRSERITKKNV